MIRPSVRPVGQDWMIAALFLFLGLLTRIPFVSNMAFSSDSARFGLAMHHFDVAQMRPHAPGYILYVAFAKALSVVLNDVTKSLVAVSLVSSAVTLALVYLLASRMYGRTTGVACSVLLLTSPLFWYNSEMPLTYALEGALTVAFAMACYEVILGKSGWLQPAAILLGLSAGVRQTLIIILAPLLLYAMRKCRARDIALSVVWCTAICLAWLIPMVVLTGGVEKYLAAVSSQYRTWVVIPMPFVLAAKGRSDILLKWLMHSLYLGALPVLYCLGRIFAVQNIMRDERVRLLLLWFVPAAIVFVGINIYNPGHVVFILPAVFVVLGESIRVVSDDLEEGALLAEGQGLLSRLGWLTRRVFSRKVLTGACVGVIATTNAYLFLLGGGEVSYAAIRQNDRSLAEQVEVTRQSFAAGRSMIVTCQFNTQASLYLPEFLICCPTPLIFRSADLPLQLQNVYTSLGHETTPKTYWVPTDFRIEPIPIPQGIDTLVFWEEDVARYCHNVDRLAKVAGSAPSGPAIFYLRVKPGEKLYYDYHFLRLD